MVLKIQKEKDAKNKLLTYFNKPIYCDSEDNCNRIIAIVGLSKNAGKTSFLNWLVKSLSNRKIAVTTTGRDGEELDLVTGKKKPRVILPKDCFFTSFDYTANKNLHNVEILKKEKFRIIGKNLFLYKSLDNIETEIVGAISLIEQREIIKAFQSLQSEYILIDGSLDRKSICLSETITDIVLVVGAALGNLNEIINQCKLLKFYSQFKYINIPKFKCISYKFSNNQDINISDIVSVYSNETKLIDFLSLNPEWLYLPGVITDVSWEKIKNAVMKFNGKIVFENPINFNIRNSDLFYVESQKSFFTRNIFPLSAVVVNSYSPYNQHIDVDLLMDEVESIFSDVPVIDITKIE